MLSTSCTSPVYNNEWLNRKKVSYKSLPVMQTWSCGCWHTDHWHACYRTVPRAPSKWYSKHDLKLENKVSWYCYTNRNPNPRTNILMPGTSWHLYEFVGDVLHVNEQKVMPQRTWLHRTSGANRPYGGTWERCNWESLNICKDNPSLSRIQFFTFLARKDALALMVNKR